jgi:hypothetical protein
MSAVQERNRDAQERVGDRPTLHFFYSPRSGPSRRVEGFLANVLQRGQRYRRFELKRVNCDNHRELARRSITRPIAAGARSGSDPRPWRRLSATRSHRTWETAISPAPASTPSSRTSRRSPATGTSSSRSTPTRGTRAVRRPCACAKRPTLADDAPRCAPRRGRDRGRSRPSLSATLALSAPSRCSARIRPCTAAVENYVSEIGRRYS